MFGFGKRKKTPPASPAAETVTPSADTAPVEAAGTTAESEVTAVEAAPSTAPLPETAPPAEMSPVAAEIVAAPESPPAEATLAAPEPAVEPAVAEAKPQGWFTRLKTRLSRTRGTFADGLANLVLGRKSIDADLLEELETLLLTADVGVDATSRIIDDLHGQVRRRELSDPAVLTQTLQQQLQDILAKCERPVASPAAGRPQVILMVGINGAGKTTTIGKLARKLQDEGNSVMLAAGDTFRAAAVEQLQTWGERNRVPVIAQHTGADAASVIYDALQAATARGVDVLIADTAGRLHTKTNLMDELSKIVRVMKKIDPEAPHEVMLVVDATTGQNALNQAQQFHQAVGLTGITLTKLDGTAKGGILFAIAERLGIPIRFIGVGESIEDLRPFEPQEFVRALFEK